MIAITQNPRVEDVRQSGRHMLYVEGADSSSLDPTVLSELFKQSIRIVPLGPAYHVNSVAQALYKEHPDSYFLIDRDHYSDAEVESTWANFPDPNTNNLLIWRKRELENYFLDPDYLRQSPWFIKAKRAEPEKTILHHANERLYLDAVNHVLVTVREEQKQTWIEAFTNPNEFKTKAQALNCLLDAPDFAARVTGVQDSVTRQRLQELFEATMELFTGGKIPLKFGTGHWRDFLRGKKILPSVLTGCFKVLDAQRENVQGDIKTHEIIKSLLKRPLSEQPADFQELHRLIMGRVRGT